jgi:hypothetical protein
MRTFFAECRAHFLPKCVLNGLDYGIVQAIEIHVRDYHFGSGFNLPSPGLHVQGVRLSAAIFSTKVLRKSIQWGFGTANIKRVSVNVHSTNVGIAMKILSGFLSLRISLSRIHQLIPKLRDKMSISFF